MDVWCLVYLLLVVDVLGLVVEADIKPTIDPPPTVRRRKRQNNDVEVTIEELCKNRDPNEYFRLIADGNCKDVVRCDRERGSARLAAVTCPVGLAFDIDRQICDWSTNVLNCDKMERPFKPKPLFFTDEPVCPKDQLACADGECLGKSFFCDGSRDCVDGTDENACGVENDPNRADTCNVNLCELPTCFCSPDGTEIPQNLKAINTPQMVTITFSGSVNIDNIGLYDQIFTSERKNPNECTMKGTFFVSHKYTNYSSVQELHRRGHEIGAFSISNRLDPNYWTHGTYDNWLEEMGGDRLIIEKFANITDNSIVGMRAPYLRVGGNTQFNMMTDQGFLYDASIAAPLGRLPLWPYTLQYRMPHKCHGNALNCPSRSHPVWEIVMNELDRREDPRFDETLSGCQYVDSCTNIRSKEQFRNFLNHNFNRHYATNKAPLGLHFQATWLKTNKEYLKEFLQFIDEKLLLGDVYFVNMFQVIQWMQKPTELPGLRDFPEWKEKCDVQGPPHCSIPNVCPLSSRELKGERINLVTCVDCPRYYPWLQDPSGDGLGLI